MSAVPDAARYAADGPSHRGPRTFVAGDGPRTGLAAYLPDRHTLIDLGFSALLVAIALVGFRTGFIGWEWVLAAGAGLVLGLLVAHVAAVRGWSALVAALVLTVVYFLLGGPFAVRNNLIGGVLPSLTTFRDLAVTVVTGWKEWLTLLPPVDARGPLLALPWFAGLVGSALVHGVARRWRGPAVVAVVPVLLLVASIALGTMQPAAKLVQGVLFTLALVLWMVVRAQRVRPAIQNGEGRTARLVTGTALLAGTALAGLVLGPHLPGADAGTPRSVVRSELTPPYDVAQFASPLAGFRAYTEPNPSELYDKELFVVSGLPAGTPLRFATLDHYDGLVWGAAGRSQQGVPFQRVGSRIAARAQGEPRTVEVKVAQEGYRGVWLPVAGSPVGVSFAGPRATALGDELWLNTDTETAVVPQQLVGGESYTLQTVLSDQTAAKLPAKVELSTGAQPADDVSFLDAKLDAWTAQANSPWEKIAAVARFMSTEGAYTDGGTPNSYEKVYLPGHGVSRLSRFAGSSQLAGNDEQYAAALALAANRLGVPSRVVLGALPGEGGVVKGKDVHAWVELRKDDGTWLSLLPATFLPDRNKKPNEQQLKSEEQKIGAQVPPPAGVNPPSVLQGPDQAQNATDIKRKKRNPLDVSAWPWWLKILILGILIPLLLALAAYALIRWLKARRRRKHASTGPTISRVAWVWRDLVSDARSFGIAVPRQATRLEQAAALPESVAPTAAALAARANAHVFGPVEPSPQDALDALTEADAIRAELRKGVARARLIRADVDVRPLFARHRAPKAPGRAETGGSGGGSGHPRLPRIPRPRLGRPSEVGTA
jgi:hypothetical protein